MTALAVGIGPVELETYLAHLGDAARRERDAIYTLVLPTHLRQNVTEQWQVGDRTKPPLLGDAAGRLGVSSYLGGGGHRRAG
jgi:hypothetical protein